MSNLTVSIIITVFNYEKYVEEAIESILNQEKFELIKEIVIVDDGSKDNSLEKINKYKNKVNNIKIVSKKNGGQLSSFNEGFKYCSGDIVCFLDADDLYKNNYIATIIDYYSNNNCDMLMLNREYFGNTNYIGTLPYTGEYGFSLFETLINYSWIGVSTSALSIKRNILNKILPLYEIEEDWITRADDCIVFGSSIVGANKHFLNKTLIKYRVHGDNFHYAKQYSKEYCYKRALSIEKLFLILLKRNNIRLSPRLLYFEYLSKKNINWSIYFKYSLIVFKTNFSLFEKIYLFLKMARRTVKKIKMWKC